MSVDSITRVERIRAELEGTGRVRVADLAAELGVSEMTVRRDLDTLAEQGVVQRVRGGAVALGPQPFAERYGHAARAKDRIADKLLSLVDDGASIGIDASTTLLRLAARLDRVRHVQVVTNSVESFAVLNGHAGVTGLLTGGQHDPRTGSLVGPLATRVAKDVLLGRLFVSAAGVDPAFGTTETTLEEAEVKEALASSASEVVVAVDSSKLGQRAAARCFNPERIDILVTDLEPTDERLRPWRAYCRVL